MRNLTRRSLVRILGGGIAGASTVGVSSAADIEASVTFEDQTIDGQEVLLAAVRASADVSYALSTPDHDTVFARGTLSAGDHDDVAIQLGTVLRESRQLAFTLYPAEGGQSIARGTAQVTVPDDITFSDGLSVTRVEADPDAGFHYPYFLYAPATVQDGTEPPLLVQPNNTGTSTDDFAEHERAARERIEGGFPRRLGDDLRVPLLIPAFPRPRSEPVDWTHYVHQLDRETMQIDGGPLERVDLQLLRMVDHARAKLAAEAYPVREKVIMNGFSASGNFVDRFAVLHPERVLSVTAGGLNGMALLPTDEVDGQTLNYHIGTADVEELTGEPVDTEALGEVNQFLFMGGEDTNDTIPYDDAWTSDQLRQTALSVYGEDMIRERFPTCQRVYEQVGVDAQFRIYEGAGHTPRPARDDIVAFHRRSMAGEDVGDFGQNIRPDATFSVTPETPRAGESVEFDAAASRTIDGTILSYTWDFGDGSTAAGETATHAFAEPGEYEVTFAFVDDAGLRKTDAVTVTVGDGDESAATDETPTSSDESTPTGSETPSATATESTTPAATPGADGPGFGVVGSLAGVAGAGAAIRWLFGPAGEE